MQVAKNDVGGRRPHHYHNIIPTIIIIIIIALLPTIPLPTLFISVTVNTTFVISITAATSMNNANVTT